MSSFANWKVLADKSKADHLILSDDFKADNLVLSRFWKNFEEILFVSKDFNLKNVSQLSWRVCLDEFIGSGGKRRHFKLCVN